MICPLNFYSSLLAKISNVLGSDYDLAGKERTLEFSNFASDALVQRILSVLSCHLLWFRATNQQSKILRNGYTKVHFPFRKHTTISGMQWIKRINYKLFFNHAFLFKLVERDCCKLSRKQNKTKSPEETVYSFQDSGMPVFSVEISTLWCLPLWINCAIE